ncbi:MAG: hypothetical protein IPG68_16280 [Micrococcales bacterium]|nr:hypothetical protein [Micrococcales bacterium]
MAPATDEQSLVHQQQELAALSEELTSERDRLENSATEQSVTRATRGPGSTRSRSSQGLADRSSSIDQTMILLRARLCEGTGLEPADAIRRRAATGLRRVMERPPSACCAVSPCRRW